MKTRKRVASIGKDKRIMNYGLTKIPTKAHPDLFSIFKAWDFWRFCLVRLSKVMYDQPNTIPKNPTFGDGKSFRDILMREALLPHPWKWTEKRKKATKPKT